QYISAGKTIHSDCCKSYTCLPKHGYAHHVVNPSKDFITADGVHTNNIEIRWHALKLSLARTGTRNYCFNKIFGTRNISMMTILPNIFSEKKSESCSISLIYEFIISYREGYFLYNSGIIPLHLPEFCILYILRDHFIIRV
ncbi:hypothetical protein HZS_2182, partial [Henneguya salminicola]